MPDLTYVVIIVVYYKWYRLLERSLRASFSTNGKFRLKLLSFENLKCTRLIVKEMVNDEKKKEKIKPLTEPWDTFDILSAVGAVVAVAVSVYFFGNGGNQDAVSRMSLSPILEMVEGLGNFSIALGEVIW